MFKTPLWSGAWKPRRVAFGAILLGALLTVAIVIGCNTAGDP